MMIQSITFFEDVGDIVKSYNDESIRRINTWDDWHMLPTARPMFTPPDVKTNYIDIPGGNGSLDLTEALTGYPLYSNRTGSFEFRVMNDYEKDGQIFYASNDTQMWAIRYSEMMEYLHGRQLLAVLADDPAHFYQGRFSVSSDGWKAGDTWSTVTINYNVNPFKWSISTSVDDWLWDPFNFETGVIGTTIADYISINSPNSFTRVLLPPDDKGKAYMDSFFGIAPISPSIAVHSSSTGGLDVRFVNTALNIDITQHFNVGTTLATDFVFYGQSTPYEIYFKGVGIVSVIFRAGRL